MTSSLLDLHREGFIVFEGSVCRYSREKYAIIIPHSLKELAGELHGRDIVVAIKPKE